LAASASDDGALVLAVQQGDADAFAELFRRHYPGVRRACARRLSDVDAADEVAQATFVRAFERIDQCAGERRFGPWVHVIARSQCMDAFRAQARVEPREQPLAGEHDHRPNEPEESLLSRERVAQMHEALASLPHRQRLAVIARDWDELRPGEIADRLGLTVGAVDSLLLRARRRLALSYRHLAGEGGGGAGTVPLRPAAAGVGVLLALGSQALIATTAAAAHVVHETAGGVVSAVVSVALSLGAGAAPPSEPPPDPPAAATTIAVVLIELPAVAPPVAEADFELAPPPAVSVPSDPPATPAVTALGTTVTSTTVTTVARPSRAVPPPIPQPPPPATVSAPAPSPTPVAPAPIDGTLDDEVAVPAVPVPPVPGVAPPPGNGLGSLPPAGPVDVPAGREGRIDGAPKVGSPG
jgi:RNA polymerase sigma-70 factor (ECF subfamily)